MSRPNFLIQLLEEVTEFIDRLIVGLLIGGFAILILTLLGF